MQGAVYVASLRKIVRPVGLELNLQRALRLGEQVIRYTATDFVAAGDRMDESVHSVSPWLAALIGEACDKKSNEAPREFYFFKGMLHTRQLKH